MTNYNCCKYIEQAIDSIIQQTVANWELIIVDDCSTDASAEIIQTKTLTDDRLVDSSAGRSVSEQLLQHGLNLRIDTTLMETDQDDRPETPGSILAVTGSNAYKGLRTASQSCLLSLCLLLADVSLPYRSQMLSSVCEQGAVA